MATIHSLPPELLHQILETAYESYDVYSWTKRQACACAFSLVAKSWQWEGQRLLWSVAFDQDAEWVEKFCASPMRGRHPTRTLHLYIGGKLAARVIKACELHLVVQTIAEPLPQEVIFHLESLILDIPSPARMSAKVIDLLVAASRGSLGHLSVKRVEIAGSSGYCLEQFKPIADQLTKLEVMIIDATWTLATVSLLATAVRLQHLSLVNIQDTSILSILVHLPSSLSTLRLEFGYYYDTDGLSRSVFTALRTALVSLEHLTSLRVSFQRPTITTRRGPEWEEFQKLCAQRNIYLEIKIASR